MFKLCGLTMLAVLGTVGCATKAPDQVVQEWLDHLVKYSTEAELRSEWAQIVDGKSNESWNCSKTLILDSCKPGSSPEAALMLAAIKIKHRENLAKAPACIQDVHPKLEEFNDGDPSLVLEAFATGRLVRYEDECNKQICEWRRSMYPLGPKDCLS